MKRKMSCVLILLSAVILSVNLISNSFAQNQNKSVNALRITEKPNIDGLLNDDSWQQVKWRSDFLQREPLDQAPPSERTEIGIMYDENNLYLGIKCFDSEPDKIIANEMRRDYFVDNDDYVEMIFDTYHDKRNGFYFITNPYGSKRDAMLSDEGKSYNPNWDGIWECKAKITDEGWFLEIALPWKTLRFKEGDNQTWGMNFGRTIRRKNEKVFWSYIPRTVGHGNVFKLSYAGKLTGLKDLKMGGNTELIPYVLTSGQNDVNTGSKTETEYDAGFDARFSLTSNMTANVSYNTDFAQVESDDEVVNLTRFSLYYPEKREFFLEGDEQFKFGSFTRSYGGGFKKSSNLSLFYSRRIGIAEGHKVPIIGGARVIGKIGRYSIGLLNMQTDMSSWEDDGETTTVNSINYGVLRIKRDILARSSMGLMVLNKEESGSEHYNRSFGFDTNLLLNDFWSVNGLLAMTVSPDEVDENGSAVNINHQNMAGNLSVQYGSDLWRLSSSYLEIGQNFNAESGFVPRTDIREFQSSIEYSPRPENSKRIRKHSYSTSFKYLSDHTGKLLDRSEEIKFGLEFHSQARFNMSVKRIYEDIYKDWEVRENIVVPAMGYTGLIYGVSANTDRSRPVSYNGGASYSDYYGGTRKNLDFGLNFNKIDHMLLSLSYRYNDISLNTGSFNTNTLSTRLSYMFTTDLFLKAYIQWNDDKLIFNGRERLVNNVMLRYIYKPGSNFYLVYNEGRYIGGDGDELENRVVLCKFTYFFRR